MDKKEKEKKEKAYQDFVDKQTETIILGNQILGDKDLGNKILSGKE